MTSSRCARTSAGSPPVPERPDFTPMLVGFTTELRRAGVTVGSGDVLTYCAASTVVDVTDLVDLYWAGRCTLVTRREQVPTYHRTFVSYFLGKPGEVHG